MRKLPMCLSLFFASYPLLVPVASAQLQCGAEVTIDVELTSDLGPCSGPTPAITIRGPARLNLNGFSVTCETGTQSPSGGIELTGQGAELQDGVVKDCRQSG